MSSVQSPIEQLRLINQSDLEYIQDHSKAMGNLTKDLPTGLGSLVAQAEFYVDYLRDTPRLSQFFISEVYECAQIKGVKKEPLFRLLSEHLYPLADINTGTKHVEAELGSSSKEFCHEAEGHFSDTLKQLQTGQYFGQPKVSVYHDQDGSPIALRKSSQESTALLLKDVSAEEIIVPRGSFVDIKKSTKSSLTSSDLIVDSKGEGWILESYCIDGKPVIAPGRLSAWAYIKKRDRRLFGVNLWGSEPVYKKKKARICKSISLHDFIDASSAVMSRNADKLEL